MSLYHSLNIGSLKLEGNFFLAPLAGYTDRTYRSICTDLGADLCYTEMVSCEGVARGGEKTIELMTKGQSEKNLAVQLFAPDCEVVKRSIEGVMKYQPSLIDINCGCPVQKVTKTGAGSALLKNPDKIGDIVKVLKQETGLPITVKIRKGWDNSSQNYLETAKIAFDSGADALCMHARTRAQLYMPFADWQSLKTLKENFPDKVIIGSGDLFTAQDGLKMLEETKIDGIVFARGAIGNPFVFEQAKNLATGKDQRFISVNEKRSAILRHLNGLTQQEGELTACREMRKHVCAYLKGIPNSSKVKQLITQSTTIRQYEDALGLLSDVED